MVPPWNRDAGALTRSVGGRSPASASVAEGATLVSPAEEGAGGAPGMSTGMEPEEQSKRTDPFSMDRTTRTFVLMVAGASIPVVMLGFNLGAFGAIFFDQFLAVWAVSTATLLTAVALRSRWRGPIWGLAILALPSLWIAIDLLYEPDTGSRWGQATLDALLVVSLLALPYLVYAITRLVSPEFFQLKGIWPKVGAVAVVLAMLGAGVLLGAQNPRYLTCEDFRLSGNDTPPNCAPGEPTTQLWKPSP